MKTETEIAKENMKDYDDSLEKGEEDMNYSFCMSHKQTCMRWLEFLETNRELVIVPDKSWGINWYVEKQEDLQQAIKIYEERGI